ncbi:MAG: diaminopimelate epimerase [Phycisphaerae bacterium]
MRFTKMQGAGNDYVYVDCFNQQIDPKGASALARAVSDRHFGVGSDGLILIMPSRTADVRMWMFNADGSEGLMCGNGIRCLAKYAYDHGLSRANPMRVETASGVKTIDLRLGPDGKVTAATVDMGEPVLKPADIPVVLPGAESLDKIVDLPLDKYVRVDRLIGESVSRGAMVEGSPVKRFTDSPIDQLTDSPITRMTCVSMGNPHVVIYSKDVAAVPLEMVGPVIERAPVFPKRVNVHFVQVQSASEVTMRTWERGSGVTLACGTGASAVCVAGVLTGRTGRRIVAHLPGGGLELEWRQSDNRVYMTGPAVEVFSGQWPDRE